MSFGERLKKSRTLKKLTQVDVGTKLGIDDTTLSKYENNKSQPDNETLLLLSSLYDVSVEWILTGKNQNVSLSEKSRLYLEEFDRLSKEDQEMVRNLIQRMPKI